MKYLLACPKCGHKTPVDAGAAGQALTCQCGQTLEVPSIRKLRHLEPVVDEPLPPLWTRKHGLIFVGSAVAVFGLAFGGYIAFNLQQPINEAAIREEISNLPPAESFARFESLQTSTSSMHNVDQMPPYLATVKNLLASLERTTPILAAGQASEIQQRMRVRSELTQWLPLAGAVAVGGILIAMAALLTGRSKRTAPGRGKPRSRAAT